MIFLLGLAPNAIKKLTAVFIFPGKSAIAKLKWRTKSYLFHKGGGINLV